MIQTIDITDIGSINYALRYVLGASGEEKRGVTNIIKDDFRSFEADVKERGMQVVLTDMLEQWRGRDVGNAYER